MAVRSGGAVWRAGETAPSARTDQPSGPGPLWSDGAVPGPVTPPCGRPGRRRVLQAALALPLLSACRARPAPPVPAGPDPDVRLRAAAVEREGTLVRAYDEALVADLSSRWAALRAEHLEHLAALGAPAAASAAATPPRRAGTRAPSVAALAEAERRAAAGHAQDALVASRALAGLLAALAASEASHPVALAPADPAAPGSPTAAPS